MQLLTAKLNDDSSIFHCLSIYCVRIHPRGVGVEFKSGIDIMPWDKCMYRLNLQQYISFFDNHLNLATLSRLYLMMSYSFWYFYKSSWNFFLMCYGVFSYPLPSIFFSCPSINFCCSASFFWILSISLFTSIYSFKATNIRVPWQVVYPHPMGTSASDLINVTEASLASTASRSLYLSMAGSSVIIKQGGRMLGGKFTLALRLRISAPN